MDAMLLEVDPQGQVKFENEDWTAPTLQERRAILYAAHKELESLQEIIDILDHN
jgi:acyl-CoA reductase-like NAD-dependent aldehyde dehydrogenase